MYDVTALGELLIDFIQEGKSPQGNNLFEANPGGAPCNVLSMLSGLGKKTAFIGKIGQDYLGKTLELALTARRIDTRWLMTTEEAGTTLAFVHKLADGDREFSFYRNPGADTLLAEEEITEEMTGTTRIFHFGTLSMSHRRAKSATKKAVEAAKKSGALISFDPNLRLPLWSDLESAKEAFLYGFSQCDILKISDNELQWISGKADYTEGVEWIQERYSIPLILVSLGKEGSRAYCGALCVRVPAFLMKDTVETTGAGDCFCGCILNYVLEHQLERSLNMLTEDQMNQMLTFANAAAAIVTTRKGALSVMPGREEVETFLAGISEEN